MFKLSDEAVKFLEENKNRKIVFTNGCFDILHCGHVSYLNDAKNLGDVLFIGLNSDESVRKLKGDDRPVNNEFDRKFMLENLMAVDFVEVFSEETPLELIKKVRPNILVKGGDWAVKDIVGHEFVLENNGEVVPLRFVEGHSTSSLIKKVQGRS